MRGHINKGTGGGKGYAAYLEKCAKADMGFGRYLESHSGGLDFTRYVDGAVTEHRGIDTAGLEMALAGRDPSSGEMLKGFREGQVRFYELPINDSKNLDVAGVLFKDVREAREAAQARGEQAVKDYVTGRLQVRIRVGDGKREWVTPDEVMWASATHQTSREGDPELHRHLVLVNRVRVGDKWYAIDSVKLFGMYENIRSVYETTVYNDPRLVKTMASHGMSLDSNGNVPELGDAADVLSKRRDQIDQRLEELVDEWRNNPENRYREITDEHGNVIGHTGYRNLEQPDDRTMLKLQQQAWADTRKTKGDWNTRVDFEAWNDELKAAGHDLRAELEGRSVPMRRDCSTVSDTDLDLCALNAVNTLQAMNSAWSLEQLEVACYDQIRELNVIGTREDMNRLCARMGIKAKALCGLLSDDPRAQARWARNLTTNAVIECETDLRGRLAARGIEQDTAKPDVERIASRFTLDQGQLKAMETICKAEPLAVVEGAAGAGKTHMLKAVNAYCEQNGYKLMLATPTRKAAQVASDEISTTAETLMKLLEAYGYRHDETDPMLPWQRMNRGETDHRGNTYHGVPEAFRMDEHTLLVIDEASMVDQDQARALLHIADETGARLTLVGDRQQLNAVGRGGVLEMAVQYTNNVAFMNDVHRFKDPDYARFTLRLHDHTRDNAERLTGELFDRRMVHRHGSDEETVEAIADEWMQRPRTAISTATNEQADMVNQTIQNKRMEAGQLGTGHCHGMIDGQLIHVGDRIMTRANDRTSGVANRQTFTVTRITAQGIAIQGDDKRTRHLTADYVREHVQLGYAATTYGVEGITSPDAIFYAAPGAAGSDLYVALTRGKNTNHVYLTAGNEQEAREQLTGIIGRDKGDKGLEAARKALQETLDQQPEPDSAERALDGRESKALDFMEQLTSQNVGHLEQVLAKAVKEEEDHLEAEGKAEALEAKAREASKLEQSSKAREEHARDAWKRVREPIVEKNHEEMREQCRKLGDYVEQGDVFHKMAELRESAHAYRRDLDYCNEWPRGPVMRIDSMGGKFYMNTKSLRRDLEDRARESENRIGELAKPFEDFRQRWGTDYRDLGSRVEDMVRTLDPRDRNGRTEGSLISEYMDRELKAIAEKTADGTPEVQRTAAAKSDAFSDHLDAERTAKEAWDKAVEARRQVKEPETDPKDIRRELERYMPSPDMTQRQRYEQLDCIYHDHAMALYRKQAADAPSDGWWERITAERADRPDDPRWLQPVADPDSWRDANMWDFNDHGGYQELSGSTLGQIIDHATEPKATERTDTEPMTVVEILDEAHALQQRNEYRSKWSRAAQEAAERPVPQPTKPMGRQELMRQLRQRAEENIRQNRNHGIGFGDPSYGLGGLGGPSYGGPSL